MNSLEIHRKHIIQERVRLVWSFRAATPTTQNVVSYLQLGKYEWNF